VIEGDAAAAGMTPVAGCSDAGGAHDAVQWATVLDILLQALAKKPATANVVVVCLDRMSALAAPALPLLREELAQPQRGNGFQSLENDEELQRLARTLITRLDPPAPSVR
jgi:hypothetical protein